MNPAERCMSILNLSLQHVSLSREKMPEQFEKMVRGKASLAAVRNQAEIHPALKEAFQSSIKPTIETVNKRFERMKLKGEKLKVYAGATEEDIERNLDIVKIASTGSARTSFSSSSKSKDFKNDAPLQMFLSSHGKSSHYCFQLMKCTDRDCKYCTNNPVRNVTMYEKLSFLPEPTPDASGAHYLPFKEATKARDVVRCVECRKPRVVYSPSKTDREQVSAKLCHQYVVIVELKINYWMTIMSTFRICTQNSPKCVHYVNYAMEMAELQKLGERNSLRREG
ncbi:hypothetical protein MAR_029223, partial [Mya arenaria]